MALVNVLQPISKALVTFPPLEAIRTFPTFDVLKSYAHSAIFVFEADLNIQEADIPRAVCELYMCGRHLW